MTTKEERELRKCLLALTTTVAQAILEVDKAMARPDMKTIADGQMGKALGKFMSALEFENDRAMHFGLGLSFRRMNVIKGRTGKQAGNRRA